MRMRFYNRETRHPGPFAVPAPLRKSLMPPHARLNVNIAPPRFADRKSDGVPFSEVFITVLSVLAGFAAGFLTAYIVLSKSVV